MSRNFRTIRRWVFIGLGLLVVVGAVAPFIAADGLNDRIEAALQTALQRRVKIGASHFSLFNGPGFVIERVLIDEDPSVGLEPFAYVASIDARVKLTSLWTRHLEFSSLTLDEPSVNLVKPPEQSWNVIPLMVRTIGVPSTAAPASGSPAPAPRMLPALRIRGGRIDFKFGDTKSVFYLKDANVDLTPRSPGSFDFEFSGETARTDRTSQGFGTFTAKGRYIHPGDAEPQVDFTMKLEPSGIDDLAQGFSGRNLGLHGSVSSRATVKGPLSNLQVSGDMSLTDIHRWDFIPSGASGSLRFGYKGTVDWRSQVLDIATTSANTVAPIKGRVRVFDFLKQPRWATEIAADKLPAEAVLNASRHMGVVLPAEFTLGGAIAGVVGYSSAAGLQGRVMLSDGVIHLSPQSGLQVQTAELMLDRDELRVSPFVVTGDEGQTAELSAEYSVGNRRLHVQVTGKALRIAELQTGSGNIMATAAVPFVEHFTRGKWTGTLEYHWSEAIGGHWSGAFDLRDARAQIPGLAQPLNVASASVEMDGDEVGVTKIRARAGDVELSGSYRYEPEATRPHKFNLTVPALDLATLEQLLLPSLRREQGFLARTLRRPVAMPDWLSHRRADGTVRIGVLTASSVELTDVRAHVLWDAADVQLTNIAARVEDGKATAQATIDISGSSPTYKLRGRVTDLPWRGGKVDFDTKLASRGTGPDFLLNLRSDGTFDARSLSLSSEAPLQTVSGLYDFSVTPGGPRITLTAVEAALGAERFSGQGSTQADGRVQIELASNTRVLRATGALSPLRLDVTLAPPVTR